MITYQEAYKLVLESAHSLGTESISFKNSLKRVLAEDIFSDLNMPPFDKSAMDGYACRKADLANELTVIEIIPAGVWPNKFVDKNQCAKIMTGAPIPKGADTVIMVEYTEKTGENTIRFTKDSSKSNICYLAEDVKKGDIVLHKGTLLGAKHIPVLASVGANTINVYKKPKIALVSTGDELVEPENIPNQSQIRNSNAYQMIAQAAELGIETEYIGIAKDTRESTEKMLIKAKNKADIILLSGAVSMGDYDFVPDILKQNGVDIKFHGIQIKPGKKTIFGINKNQWFMGVPGNPVSSFVQFEMLLKPLILKIMNANKLPENQKFTLGEDFYRKNAQRLALEPVIIHPDGTVNKVSYHGSAHINAISYANGLMLIERNKKELKKGELVDVRPI